MSLFNQKCSGCKEFHPLQSCQEFQKQSAKIKVADLLNRAADFQFQAGKYEEALRLYSQAISKDSSRAKFFGDRCAALLKLGKYEDAFYDGLQATELDPNFLSGYEQALCSALCIGEIHQAEGIIKRFKHYHPSDPSLDEYLDKLKKLKDLLKNASHYYENNDFKTCLNFIENVLQISHKHIEILQLKASCFEALNRLEEALNLRNMILENDPKNAKYMREKAFVLQRLGNLHEALLILKCATVLDPHEDEAVKQKRQKIEFLLDQFCIGQEYFITGRLLEAVQTFTNIISADPENRKFNKCILDLRGEAFFNLCRYKEASIDFSESFAIGGMTARHLYLRACCEASMHLQWTQQAKSLSESTIHFFTAEKKCSYETLGVSENSSIEEINTAYQNLFLKFHPQQNENVSDEEQMKLGWKLGEIAKAYVELAELKAKPVFVPIEPPTLVQHQLILLEQQALKLEQKGMAQLEHLTKSSNSDINNTKVLQKKKSKEDCSVM